MYPTISEIQPPAIVKEVLFSASFLPAGMWSKDDRSFHHSTTSLHLYLSPILD